MAASQTLQGLRILVTRPVHQAARLTKLITAAGGIPVALPVLAIAEPEDLGPARALVSQLHAFDVAIFVSANAAEKGMALIHRQGGLPGNVKLAAAGQRTSEALLRHGGRIDIQAPPPFNSEALLAAAELQAVRGKNIAIFRGEGGRELLADTLRQRGATVSYAEVYRRVQPENRLAAIIDREKIDIVTITSQSGLSNLVTMADLEQQREWLLSTPLAVISARIAQLATELGFKYPPLVAERADDEALVQAMTTWRRGGQTAQ